MKIAIDIRMTDSGGIGSYLSALLPYFIKENQCVLLGTKEQLEPYKTENCRLLEYNEKCFSIKEMYSFPKNLLKEINECDVYYSPYCNIPGGIKIPVFTTIHDVVFLDVPGLAGKAGTLIRKYFYMRACKKSKAVFTVSNFSAERIQYHLKRALKNTPVICTYNALPDWFKDETTNKSAGSAAVSMGAASQQPAPKDDVILFVGNIKKHKGLSTLLTAFLQAKKKGLSSKLVIVGNRDNFRTADNSIFEKIETAPEGSVIFTGKVNQEKLKETYQKARVLVQPSFYEGFGMPPLEALSLGTHVILSDIPVFREIYKDFPVTFFETGNASSLEEKLLKLDEICSTKLEIPEIYSFSRTYSIIHKTLEEK